MRGSILVLALAALVSGCDRRSPPVEQGNAAAVSPDEVAPRPALASAAPSTARFDRSHHGEPAPDFAFADAAGKGMTLAAFRGRPVLVNLWATWCGPCVKELPTLDGLAARPGKAFAMVALSQDLRPELVAPFVAAHGINALPVYTDAKMAWSTSNAATLPTTILYDAGGHEVWRRVGDLDWTGAEAAKALAEAG